MLQLYNLEHKKIHGLIEYKDARLERELKSGDEKFSFSYPIFDKFYKDIVEESYIRTKENEFIVKEIHELDDWTGFTCILNVEDLEGKPWDRYESVERNIVDALNLAMAGTGWRVGSCNVTKKRTVRKTNCSSWDIVQDIKKTYMVDMQFDCINKRINIYEHLGNDKGVYFIDSLNVRKLETQKDSYEFYTRIIPIGKDGLNIKDINNGKDYVENHQYSNKVKTIYWKDDRYTVKENLKTDAQIKLNEMSKPRRAYKADIINLAKNSNDKYKVLDYRLGDTITLISKSKKVKEKQRIVKITEFLQDHSKDTVEIANTILSFEEMQQELQEAAETVSNITTDNGTVDGSCVDNIETKQISDFKANVIKVTNLTAINADIENLHVKKADIQDLNVVRERVGTLEATTITTTELKAVDAKIVNLESSKANITDLNVINEKVKIIEGDTANISTILAGNITAKNIATNAITAGSGIIAEGSIGDAEISSIKANKISSGTVDTNLITIASDNDELKITGNQILVNENNKNRVILGEYKKEDGSKEYGLLVRGKDNKTIMLDGNGVHNAGLTSNAIKDNVISDDANISGHKIDINSVIREVNKDNVECIKGTKVQVGDRTLDVELSTQNNKINENDKELSIQKTSINALDKEIKLKVDNQIFSKANEETNTKIKDAIEKINTTNTDLHKATSQLDILQNQISTKVSQSDIDKSIKEIKIGGRNLIVNSNINETSNLYGFATRTVNLKEGDIVTLSVNGRVDKETLEDNKRLMIFLFDPKWEDTESITITSLVDITVSKTHKIKKTGLYYICAYLHDASKPRNGKVTVNWYKLEYGTVTTDWTPAPEDLNKVIADNQKIIEEKINTNKSEINQTTDSIKQQVSSLNSKTTTIEDSLKNKADTTTLNNKVATIENSINGITQKIESTEANINNVNSNINKTINNKIAEIKTTTDGINLNLENTKSTLEKKITSSDEKIKNLNSSIDSNTTKINIIKNEIDNKIENIQTKTNTLEVEADKIKDLATSMATGKMLYTDPTFKTGYNNVGTYNNAHNGNVIVERIDKITDCPTNSTHCIKITTKGSASPYWGGFYFATPCRANAIFITRFIAKIPLGRKVEWFSNAIGEKGKKEWLTSTEGTGEWKEYICKVTCGNGGAFSSTNFFALLEGNDPVENQPLIWYLAYATVFDITENDESINDLKIETSETKRNLTEIKSNLDGITQKVVSSNSTIEKLNNELVNCTNRVSSAEQKISPSNITNTVLNSQQYLNDLNTKVNLDSFTKLQQKSDSFEAEIKTNSPLNFVKNSVFGTGDLQNWQLWGVPSWAVYKDFSLGHEFSCKLQCFNQSTGIYQKVSGFVLNQWYTVSAKLYVDEGSPGLMVDNNGTWNGINFFSDQGYHKWVTVNFTFTAKANEMNLYVGRVNNAGNVATFWVSEVQVRPGKIVLPWINAGNEICGSTIKADTNEIKIEFENGAYSLMGRKGLEHWHNGMCRPYHYINYYVVRPQIRNGALETIVLPDDFQGKELNRDFMIVAQHGDIDSNVGARFQKDAIRNIFIKIISWNSSSRQLIVQPCMQKIGVVTATHWGWDANTTTPGKTIGEGAIDVIIMAQM